MTESDDDLCEELEPVRTFIRDQNTQMLSSCLRHLRPKRTPLVALPATILPTPLRDQARELTGVPGAVQIRLLPGVKGVDPSPPRCQVNG
jgi:hypothetical protein